MKSQWKESFGRERMTSTALVACCAISCGGLDMETEDSAALRTAELAALQEARECVVAIAEANTTRLDNIAEVRAQLTPYVERLAESFARARRFDEVQLTKGAWKNLWFDDDDIQDRAGLALDRAAIYQVVEDGYYYNVANNHVLVFGLPVGTVHSFLKGNYRVIRPATPANQGEQRLNVIDLEFDENRIRLGPVPQQTALRTLVDRIERRRVSSIPVPGPRGITGELWNLYIDQDLRISAGIQDDDPSVQDLYILRRTTWAGPLPPYSSRAAESCR